MEEDGWMVLQAPQQYSYQVSPPRIAQQFPPHLFFSFLVSLYRSLLFGQQSRVSMHALRHTQLWHSLIVFHFLIKPYIPSSPIILRQAALGRILQAFVAPSKEILGAGNRPWLNHSNWQLPRKLQVVTSHPRVSTYGQPSRLGPRSQLHGNPKPRLSPGLVHYISPIILILAHMNQPLYQGYVHLINNIEPQFGEGSRDMRN